MYWSVITFRKKVIDEMVLNVCRLFKSNWGLSITGYATPAKTTGNKLLAYCTLFIMIKLYSQKK